MAHRIREAMSGHKGLLGSGGTPVEVDETYWGNVGKQAPGARGWAHKMKVVSLVERSGHKRSFHVANVNDILPFPFTKWTRRRLLSSSRRPGMPKFSA
jgi:hypothetical protein